MVLCLFGELKVMSFGNHLLLFRPYTIILFLASSFFWISSGWGFSDFHETFDLSMSVLCWGAECRSLHQALLFCGAPVAFCALHGALWSNMMIQSQCSSWLLHVHVFCWFLPPSCFSAGGKRPWKPTNPLLTSTDIWCIPRPLASFFRDLPLLPSLAYSKPAGKARGKG